MASFRAVLFRMVPKLQSIAYSINTGFRAVLFRMVPKHHAFSGRPLSCFRAVLFRMVPKHSGAFTESGGMVLELCCFEWFQNLDFWDKLDK